jgi:hypothetical protein
VVGLKLRHGIEHNLNSTDRGVLSSQPTQKKKPCLLPESNTVAPLVHMSEQTWEKTPIIRWYAKLRLSMLTKSSFHRVTKPNTTYLSNTGWSEHIVTTPTYTCVHTHRVDVAAGWTEGNHSLTSVRSPSHTSVPHPPSWRRVGHLPFKFAQDPCFYVFFPPPSAKTLLSPLAPFLCKSTICLVWRYKTRSKKNLFPLTQRSFWY